MSINWSWKDKIGEITNAENDTVSLYRCNGLMVALHEWKEEDKNYYCLAWFFSDEQHAKNCLGITKGHCNIFSDSPWRNVKLKPSFKESYILIKLIAQAKLKNITIELG